MKQVRGTCFSDGNLLELAADGMNLQSSPVQKEIRFRCRLPDE
jgi:hypothetical protein